MVGSVFFLNFDPRFLTFPFFSAGKTLETLPKEIKAPVDEKAVVLTDDVSIYANRSTYNPSGKKTQPAGPSGKSITPGPQKTQPGGLSGKSISPSPKKTSGGSVPTSSSASVPMETKPKATKSSLNVSTIRNTKEKQGESKRNPYQSL
jgi:hypothetical protein